MITENEYHEALSTKSFCEKNNLPVPKIALDLIAKYTLQQLEANYLCQIEGAVPQTLYAINKTVEAKVIIALEYSSESLTRIAVTRNDEVLNSFELVREVKAEEEETVDEDEVEEETTDSKRKRSPSVGFSVHFADGHVVKERNAIDVMVKALKYMGLERASKFKEESFEGYPLICRQQRITNDNREWQKFCDGWWIYAAMDNYRKIYSLRAVARMLKVDMEIKMNDGSPAPAPDEKYIRPKGDNYFVVPTKSTSKPSRRRALFSLNGGDPVAKNRSVLNVVRLFLSEMPSATYADVKQFFPNKLQGSYGVVRSLQDIRSRQNANRTEVERWFLNEDDVLMASDGIRFAVSKEWGDNFAAFQRHVADQFGWTLTEVS